MALAIYGNASTFNLESVLHQNILNSLYYNKTCGELSTWDEIVDEIYDNVDHVEPWMSGNARGPSTAFCLLHRLFTLKLNSQQVKRLLDHSDSPFIRAVGFLYLRYVADPKTLWGWFSPYAKDREEFSPSPGGRPVTMGDFVRDLLLEQYYFETIFPRIPKTAMDTIVDELKSRGLPTQAKGNGGAGGPDRRGVDDGNKRPASVKASLSVAFGQRAPNRAGAREDNRLRDLDRKAPEKEAAAAGARRKSPEPERPRDRSPDYRKGGDRNRDRERSYGGDRGDRDRDRGDRDRGYGAGRDRGGDRDRSYGGDRDRGDRERGYGGDRDRERYDRDRERDTRRRSRSRSRDRGNGAGARDAGRDARDVFRDSAAARGADDGVRSRYGDASGKLFDERAGSGRLGRGEEVYKLGGQGGAWR